MTAGELCTANVVIGRQDWSVVEAAQRMAEYDVGDLVIIEGEGTMYPVGILTDRDLVVRVLARRSRECSDLTIGSIMSRDLLTAHVDEDLSALVARMRSHNIRRLPVVNHSGRLEGIICFDDIVSWISEQMRGLGSVARAAKSAMG